MTQQYMKKWIVFGLLVIAVWHLSGYSQGYAQNELQPIERPELAQMLAPIALYPDALLSQILIAASYPFEVVEAERWITKNPYLTGQALDDALSEKDWDVSILALCHYPKVLTMMTENLSWTARLGDAFVAQEQDVMDVVQELRTKARARGALATTSEQTIVDEGNVIRIMPADENYLHVPAYDPYYVYGAWYYPAYPPFRIYYPGAAIVGAGVTFSPGFYIGFGFFGWSGFNWAARHVVVVRHDRPKRHDRFFHGPKEPPRIHWRPDDRRRLENRKRMPEIPPSRQPAKPLFRVQDRQDREVKKGRGYYGQPSGTPQPAGPRAIERQPDLKPGAPEKPVPPRTKPPVMDRSKPTPSVPGPVQTVEPKRSQPIPVGPRAVDRPSDIRKRAPESAGQPQTYPSAPQQSKPTPSIPGPGQTMEPKRSQPVPAGPRAIDSPSGPVKRAPAKAEPSQSATPAVNQPKTAPSVSGRIQRGESEGKKQRTWGQDEQKMRQEVPRRRGGENP